MLKIGITGGIGSGKSIVGKVFEQLGIPVYRADEAAKELLYNDEEVRNEVLSVFGEEVLDDSGLPDRKKLAAIVFSDKEKLVMLNGIIHPVVAKDFDTWATNHSEAPYVMKEAAILFESGAYKGLDKVIAVTAPVPLRVDRVVARDHVTATEVEQRMKNQMEEEERISRSDVVIKNDEAHLVIPQVLEIHHQLIG